MFKGTLTYSHPLGTVLPIGRHKLQVHTERAYIHTYIHACMNPAPGQVSFWPEDPDSVLPAKAGVVLEVSKRAPRIVVDVDPATGKQVVRKIEG